VRKGLTEVRSDESFDKARKSTRISNTRLSVFSPIDDVRLPFHPQTVSSHHQSGPFHRLRVLRTTVWRDTFTQPPNARVVFSSAQLWVKGRLLQQTVPPISLSPPTSGNNDIPNTLTQQNVQIALGPSQTNAKHQRHPLFLQRNDGRREPATAFGTDSTDSAIYGLISSWG
jgi:hypothetical protein